MAEQWSADAVHVIPCAGDALKQQEGRFLASMPPLHAGGLAPWLHTLGHTHPQANIETLRWTVQTTARPEYNTYIKNNTNVRNTYYYSVYSTVVTLSPASVSYNTYIENNTNERTVRIVFANIARPLRALQVPLDGVLNLRRDPSHMFNTSPTTPTKTSTPNARKSEA
jgi:hypothetical protein